MVQRVLMELAPRWLEGDESVHADLPPGVTLLAQDRYVGPGLEGQGFEGRDLRGVAAVAAQVVTDALVTVVTAELTLEDDGPGWSPAGAGGGPGPRLDDPATRPGLRQGSAPMCAPSGGTVTLGRRADVLRLREDVVSVRVGDRELTVPDHGTVVVVSVRGVDSTVTLTTSYGGRWRGEVDDIDRFFSGLSSWDLPDLAGEDLAADAEHPATNADASASWTMSWPDPG